MIKEHVEKIVSGLGLSSVSGDDQDLEDVVVEAHYQARRSFCRPTLWETEMNGHQTGNWKYCNDKEINHE